MTQELQKALKIKNAPEHQLEPNDCLHGTVWPIFSALLLFGFIFKNFSTDLTSLLIAGIVFLHSGFSLQKLFQKNKSQKLSDAKLAQCEKTNFDIDWEGVIQRHSHYFSAAQTQTLMAEQQQYEQKLNECYQKIKMYQYNLSLNYEKISTKSAQEIKNFLTFVENTEVIKTLLEYEAKNHKKHNEPANDIVVEIALEKPQNIQKQALINSTISHVSTPEAQKSKYAYHK